MPRYLANFTETVDYSIEFDSDEELTADGSDDWFHAMERDPANLDWLAHGVVDELKLNDLQRLDDSQAGAA